MPQGATPFAPSPLCLGVELTHFDPDEDFALLKVDFATNAMREWLKNRVVFPHITISTRRLDEGEPVYGFGYPLSEAQATNFGPMVVGTVSLAPRITSAVVSADREKWGPRISSADPDVYVLDKALNYGNSGGPIVATESGHVHALCSRFQPVAIPQNHLKDAAGNAMPILIPSLYGVVTSLASARIIQILSKENVPYV
jgi:hypothetical protein